MPFMKLRARRVFGWLLVLIATLVGGALSYRAVRQYRIAGELQITAPAGIAEASFVRVGGLEQWVQIRGENRSNPVLLVLHGGPGMPYAPFTPLFRTWEQHFTVVFWDRRGVGKTLARHGESASGVISFDRLAADGLELSEYLRERLGQDKILLLGHSVGSVVGVLMAKRRPELFAAYVGTDQIVDMAANEAVSYRMLVDRVHASGDAAVERSVAEVGPPPYTDADRWFRKQQLISATDPVSKSFENRLFPMILTAPDYTLLDMMAVGKGLKYSARALLAEMMSLDVRSLGLAFATPVVFILGENDVLDPTALAVSYFDTITAPSKKLVVLTGAGHNAMLMFPGRFLDALLATVRPLATPAPKRG